MFAGMALSVRLYVCAGLSLFIIYGPYLYVVVCVFYAYNLTFRENIETLVSYNIRSDGFQQDCLYIEQGHLMTPTTFMTYSMAIDPRKSVVVTWTPIRMYSTRQQGFQPSSLPESPLYTSS